MKDLLKKAMKLFRFSRAPFATGRFGQQIAEARQELYTYIQLGKVDDLVDMWLSGVARDRGVPDDSFGKSDLLELLKSANRSMVELDMLFFVLLL